VAQTDIDWLKSHSKAKEVSPFGESVACLLGDLYRGIYHINDSALFHKRVEWHSNHHIEIVLGGVMASFDGNLLTRLVVLAHDRCIRVSVSAASPDYFRLLFHPRVRSSKLNTAKHPTLEEHIEWIREGVKVSSGIRSENP
jgi:hypothetical protein